MPGVYTTALNTAPQSVQPKRKPRVVTREMDVHGREGGEDLRGNSPLIDLTSRSPSPALAPQKMGPQKPAPQQLSSYASSAETRVKTSALPMHTSPSPAPDNPLEQPPSPAPAVSLQQIVHNSEAVPYSNLLSVPASGNATSTTSSAPSDTRSVVTTASQHSPRSLEHPMPHPPRPVQVVVMKKTKVVTSVGNPPPALVEYVNNSPTDSDCSSGEITAPQIEGESLQFDTNLTQDLPLCLQAKDTAVQGAAVVNQRVTMSSSESSSSQSSTADASSSVCPPKVGVVLPEPPVAADFPPLRMKCVVGEEEVEGGGGGESGEPHSARKREEEEEDSGLVMELHFEESTVDAADKREMATCVHLSPSSTAPMETKETVGEGPEGPEEDLESRSNSIGMSPSPPSEVRGHGTPSAVGAEGREVRMQLEVEEEEDQSELAREGHSQISSIVPTKLSETFHSNRPVIITNSHGSPSLVLKGSVATVSPSLMHDNDGGSEERGYMVGEREKGGVPPGHNGDILVSYRARKVAKVKQFFTTLQHFGNKQSTEVAEQVQELIAALMNGTATIEEFHQEIQTVTNHPLRQFIIPFLRENLDLFREELRESEQALSDILCNPLSTSPLDTITVTPQMIDGDDIPVLPHTKTPLTPTLTSHMAPFSSSSSSSSPSLPHTAEPATSISSLNPSTMQRSVHSQTHPTHAVTTMTFEPSDSDSAHNSPAGRKRQRQTSSDRPAAMPLSDIQTTTVSDKTMSSVKRARHDLGHTHPPNSLDTVVVTSTTRRAPTSTTYPYPPTLTPHQHTPSHSPHDVIISQPHTHTQSQGHTGSQVILHPPPPPVSASRKQLLSEDLAHMDMMLNSVVGMVEKVRTAMALLKERAFNSNSEQEKREQEQQRLAEATEKARRHWQEEKLHIQRETARKLKETVAQVKADMEQKIAQAQSLAVQETLKEANTQSNSKECCWNCGRRATETCSGCNKARYCGTFCQHKDWGSHMHQCASGLIEEQGTGSATSSSRAQHVIIQSGDARMTSSATMADDPPDIKPRISPEQIMNVQQITVRYPMT